MNRGITHNQGEGRVTVIIPAYNEADLIGEVLSVLSEVKDLQQIIVVDDGSQDATVEQVKTAQLHDRRIDLLCLEANGGKGHALLSGVQLAEPELVLFLDADLMDLQPHHIPMLVEPVRAGRYDMTLGIFEHGRWHTDFTHRIFPFLSGQRCLRWRLFRGLFAGESARWSIETAFNLHAWYHKLKVEYVPWPGVTHATRGEKKEGLTGYWSHVKMWWQIATYSARFFLTPHEYEQGRIGRRGKRSRRYLQATGSKYQR